METSFKNPIDAMEALARTHLHKVRIQEDADRNSIVLESLEKFGPTALRYMLGYRPAKYYVYTDHRWYSTGYFFFFRTERDAVEFKISFC